MSAGVVSFYLPDRKALGGLDAATIDPDDWELFGSGVYVWVLQTYLRLRAAGAPVELVDAPPVAGVVVVHADYVDRLLAEASSPDALIVVSIRTDRRPQLLADVEIVQNAAGAGGHRVFIPHWPQQRLISRDTARTTRVEVIAYIGRRKQLLDDLAAPTWAEMLRARGLRWDSRMVDFVQNDQRYAKRGWNDYSGVDVVVALRPPSLWGSWSKPATKLQNAWAAGVPAILSPEVPYRELRRSPLDYLEAQTPTDVLNAIEKLRSDPELYAAMVQNGRERAAEFGHERIVGRWTDALWQEVPARTCKRRRRVGARYRRSRALVRRARGRWRWPPLRT